MGRLELSWSFNQSPLLSLKHCTLNSININFTPLEMAN